MSSIHLDVRLPSDLLAAAQSAADDYGASTHAWVLAALDAAAGIGEPLYHHTGREVLTSRENDARLSIWLTLERDTAYRTAAVEAALPLRDWIRIVLATAARVSNLVEQLSGLTG